MNFHQGKERNHKLLRFHLYKNMWSWLLRADIFIIYKIILSHKRIRCVNQIVLSWLEVMAHYLGSCMHAIKYYILCVIIHMYVFRLQFETTCANNKLGCTERYFLSDARDHIATCKFRCLGSWEIVMNDFMLCVFVIINKRTS